MMLLILFARFTPENDIMMLPTPSLVMAQTHQRE